MVNVKSLLASVATAGLLFANPALAASSRSSDSLPSASTSVSPKLVRASAPLAGQSELNPQATRLLLLFGVIGAVGLVIAASSGGGNDSPDSP